MPEERDDAPYVEPPEAGIGGEGLITDLSVLAPTTDSEVAEGVHAALMLDPDVDAKRFSIEVEHGVVRLFGPGCSEEERRRAVDAARRVQGVRRVVDRTES